MHSRPFENHGQQVMSAHFFGLMWFTNLCSPYINILLNRSDVPNLVYAAIMSVVVLSFLRRKESIAFHFPNFALAGGLYLIYTAFLSLALGTRQESWGFAIQGGSVIFAMLVYRYPREVRIILSWIASGMAGYGAFLVWQSVTGYVPPWLKVNHFMHEIGSYIRAGEGFGEKNYAGALMVLGTTIVWAMAFYRQIPRLLVRAFLLFCFLGILYTFSRGALVAFSMVLVTYVLTSTRRIGKITLMGVVSLPLIFYFVGELLELNFGRFTIIGSDIQATSRLYQFIGGWHLLLDSSVAEAIFGHGPFVTVDYLCIHNTPMGLLVEQGLVGFILWLWIMATIAHSCLKELRRRDPYPLMALAGFLTAALFIRIEVERNFWLLLLVVYAVPILSKGIPKE